MLKKIVSVASVASVAFCGAALAADIPARKAPAPVYTNPAPVSMWEGFYVGVHGGYASGDVDASIAGNRGSGSPKGGFGGFQIGYNYLVTPNWLVGYEADASFGDLNDSASPLPTSRFEVDKFGTARGRLGYVSGPWLLYGTFGTAWATSNLTAGGPFDLDRVNVGWAGGAGIEYAFLPNWSAKVEYLYADFGETRRTAGGLPASVDLTMNMVRAGLNYHFGNVGTAAQASANRVNAPAYSTVSWNGPYIGVHGGYGWGDFDSNLAGFPTNLDPSGGFGGIQGGYNWQFAPHWVTGLEADSSWGSINDSSGANKVKIDEMGTVRGRLGYAVNRTLLYGTGGLAWAHVDSTTTAPGTVPSDHYFLGWTAGAGVEYRFAPRWSAKVEYAYTDFGKMKETLGGPVIEDKLDVHTIKVGLNYQASLFGLFTQ